MKEILKNSFWQLAIIYTAIVLLVSLGFLSRYALQFNILAIIIGLIGAFSLKKDKQLKIHQIFLIFALILIVVIRIIPYLTYTVPLGYDPGLYKYGIEKGLTEKQDWILSGGMEPGFLYLMQPLKLFFSTESILKYIFIFFCLLLGLAIYFTSKQYFNNTTAIISVFIYALSLIQFKTFWYLYYKNVIGMTTMLFAFYFLNKEGPKNKWLFIIFSCLTGIIHRPTFYILGLSYFVYCFTSPYQKGKYNKTKLIDNILSGIYIILITLVFYLNDFLPAIISILPWVAQGFIDPGQSPGTFINFFQYQYSILPYFAMAILGLAFSLRKNLKILEIWAILNLSIVYFQFFFFNRFIIMLDLISIIFAGYGFSLLIENKKKLGTAITILLLFSMTIFAFNESLNSKPLLTQNELDAIKQFSTTEKNSFVMSTSSYYSPWIQGYSERKTIAPGLFDYDNHTKQEWQVFWQTNNQTEINLFLTAYPKPLYIFIGQRQKDNLAQFPNCFNKTYELDNNKIYQYLC